LITSQDILADKIKETTVAMDMTMQNTCGGDMTKFFEALPPTSKAAKLKQALRWSSGGKLLA
jgi:hypothetical protein